MSVNEHSSRTVLEAKRLAAGGWKPHEIARMLGVSTTTIRTWIDPRYLERRRSMYAAAGARRRAAASVRLGNPRMRPETKLRRVRALSDAGLAMADVAKVMALDFGGEWNAGMVKTVLEGGVPFALRREQRERDRVA